MVKSESKVNTVYSNMRPHEFGSIVEHENGIVCAAFQEGLIHIEVLDSTGGFLKAKRKHWQIPSDID